MAEPRWVQLSGADNVRDLGGLPTDDGRAVQPGRLIRSANLQELTDDDVARLVEELHVRAVADLRTGVEVTNEGPGPLHHDARVDVRHFSLFPEAGEATDAARADDDSPVVLPWQEREQNETGGARPDAATVYLRYLDDRPDSVLATLRLIAGTDGATLVHCAAGKDRTGVVIAFALAEVGVTREAIVEDYVRSGEAIEAILARLFTRSTYAGDVDDPGAVDADKHRPRAGTMQRFLDELDARYGGPSAWLRRHGWTDADAQALRHHLLDPQD
ncbi:tyrosine-protein phosphatase [uncultured Jatrophihabitans sp.]|uniref:tyrosine-protein phosphatase n=1 Tax=uncultured Jatrophihabitans sp. TaxID=1610747 RepID=UPI0035C96268